MVFGGVSVEGREIRLDALAFIVDDSAWLQEAPLDVDALPVRGATYFSACAQALWSVETPAVGETRGGTSVGHPSSHGDRA